MTHEGEGLKRPHVRRARGEVNQRPAASALLLVSIPRRNAGVKTPLLPLLALAAVLAGCQEPAVSRSPATQRNSAEAARWMERRAAQYEQMGLKKGEAAMKASDDWQHLGNAVETYPLYDSAAKRRAEQDKFEDDLAKAKKTN